MSRVSIKPRALQTLLALAKDPRIYLKASAFYAIDPSPDHLDAREHTARVIEAFGPSRIMWGSDFSPVLDSPGFSLVPPWFIEMLGSDAADVMGATLGALLQIIGRASMTADHK